MQAQLTMQEHFQCLGFPDAGFNREHESLKITFLSDSLSSNGCQTISHSLEKRDGLQDRSIMRLGHVAGILIQMSRLIA